MRSILHIALASAVIVAAALSASPAVAQTITVKVPFSFEVAGKTFPAGNYWLSRDDQRDYVTLAAKSSSQYHTSCLIGPGTPSPSESKVALNFDTVGQTHLLQSIQYGTMISGKLDRQALESERVSMAHSVGR
ncbi:hypothetical protein [Occallatibacter riparius]|uniref:Uncharacterized protein n=1 Tax=Occallatibacter riparius TaxID=1002689 RepID=A0A9J7BKI5_9BACT|nr:hypothetical protein [Occallatibacter riparius]UWZ82953.1 hypothetical protein MOP44_20570 [Occallatibacter riparius]